MFLFRNKSIKIKLIKRFLLTSCLALSSFSITGCDQEITTQQPIDINQTRDTGQSTGARIDSPFANLNEFFNCLDTKNIPLIAAHRGGILENSIEGMQATLAQTPAIMELDVATSKDGVLFLMHDDTLDRTTTGTGSVENRTWDYIKSQNLIGINGQTLDAHPPLFSDVLDWAKGLTILQIDFKFSTRFEDVVRAVRRAKATSRIIYVTYSIGQARKLHRLHPEAMISISLSSLVDIDTARQAGIPLDRMIGWTGNEAPRQRLFDLLNKKGIEVIFGTLGGRNSIDKQISQTGREGRYASLQAMGIDVLATDRPGAAYQALIAAGRTMAAPSCGVSGP